MRISKINNDLVCINTPQMDNNTFLLFKEKKVVVIDPSFAGDDVINYLDSSYQVVGILLTHAHFDHNYDVNKILKVWDCPVYLHKEDKNTYEKFHYANLVDMQLIKFDNHLKYFTGKELIIGDFKFEVMLTPGHTPGSVCYKYNNYAFVGDTLFYNSYGRTDLAGGSDREMVRSLKLLWKNLQDEDFVLSGHSKNGSFAEVKKYNYIVNKLMQ